MDGGFMDAQYFLRQRTDFIRFFYDESIKPFDEIKRRIELNESPYDDPPYSEDGEPPFLSEWMDAESAKVLVGLSSVSLLSDSLKLYFQTLQSRVIGFTFGENATAIAKKHGFVAAYREALGHILGTDWSDCPIRFDVIEQVVLARNRSQHGSDLTTLEVRHDGRTLERHPKPFFASEAEWQMWQDAGGNIDSFFAPAVQVTRERLFSAIDEVEKLAEWVDANLHRVTDWRQRQISS
jgi:hypothetical protein